ncbi:MAG TPA: hypothetical protein PLQ85_11580 [Anaerolineae bacterium]|nr:hypothetical protein [Anaerolineae bacterium]
MTTRPLNRAANDARARRPVKAISAGEQAFFDGMRRYPGFDARAVPSQPAHAARNTLVRAFRDSAAAALDLMHPTDEQLKRGPLSEVDAAQVAVNRAALLGLWQAFVIVARDVWRGVVFLRMPLTAAGAVFACLVIAHLGAAIFSNAVVAGLQP